MRTMLIFTVLIFAEASNAQSSLPLSFAEYRQRQSFAGSSHVYDSASNKWSLSTYSSISTSFSFFKGGNATIIAAPLGLQVNRRLNNNLYAFAAVSAVPAYINFNNSFLSSNINKAGQNNSFLKSNSFNIYPKAELGLMYVNDARTFSISGSIGIEKSSYLMMPYNQINTAKPNMVVSPNR